MNIRLRPIPISGIGSADNGTTITTDTCMHVTAVQSIKSPVFCVYITQKNQVMETKHHSPPECQTVHCRLSNARPNLS